MGVGMPCALDGSMATTNASPTFCASCNVTHIACFSSLLALAAAKGTRLWLLGRQVVTRKTHAIHAMLQILQQRHRRRHLDWLVSHRVLQHPPHRKRASRHSPSATAAGLALQGGSPAVASATAPSWEGPQHESARNKACRDYGHTYESTCDM